MHSALRHRNTRLARVISRRWQKRLIFFAGGLAVGAAAVLLAMGANEAQALFQQLIIRFPYAGFIVTPAGFGLAVYLTQKYFANTQGSGIPQVIAARKLETSPERSRLVGPRIAIGKLLMTLLGLLAGASTGREGPTVQIGAAIMFTIGRFSPRRQPGLLLAGAAAGVAAAFNTPLAGIVFAIEEMSRSFEARTSGLIIGAVILAGLTSLALAGEYTYFGTSTAMLKSPFDWLSVPACGVAGGLCGGAFSQILILASRSTGANRVWRWARSNPVVFGVSCGIVVALCSAVTAGAVAGTGYAQARMAVQNSGRLPLDFAIFKFVATLASSISGIPGGIFSPSIAVGAGIGADIAQLFPGTAPGSIVLLGMVAYFTGVVRAPITSFVIVSEMTDNHAMLVPLMAAAVIADASSRLVCREGVYHALAKGFLARQELAQTSPPELTIEPAAQMRSSTR